MCVKPLYRRYDRAVWLVEFIEMYRLLGVTDFIFYNHSVGHNVEGSIKVPVLSEPTGRLYSREVSTYDFVTDSPTLPDPYESVMVEARKSNVPGADDGLFAR